MGDACLRPLNILSFERFKWGGVRRDNVAYVAFDLEQFVRAPRLQPTRADCHPGTTCSVTTRPGGGPPPAVST
jgi:hypothetical protein